MSSSAQPSSERRRLVAVVGATGTGKSALAVALAEAFDGEVVNTDAYALYRGMDVGTAKPEPALRDRAQHHLIDIADPDEPVALARYLELAQAALDDIWARGRLPVLAGGSGQYVWALLEGWQVPRVPPDPELRARLEALADAEGAAAVHSRLAAIDPEGAAHVDAKNLRRVVRALEVVTRLGRPLAACQTRQPIDAEVLVIGLRIPRDVLYARLDAREIEQFEGGLINEVQRLRNAGYGGASPVRGGAGYREVSAYLDGEYDLAEALRRAQNANHRLARRQGAWFRDEDPRIHWLAAETDPLPPAKALVENWLHAKA